MRRPPSTLVLALLVATALTAGCGLKQEQLDALKQQQNVPGQTNSTGGVDSLTTGGTTGLPGTTGGTTGLPGTTGSTTGIPGTSGGTTGLPGTTGSTSGSTTGGTTGSTTGTQNVKCSTLGQNVPGITPTEIRVGVHAPQTGTGAPLPPSFADGVQVYWKNPKHKVCGRTVVIDFQDDKYTPQTARDVCGPMSRRDFLIIGAAGTDQIQSCATMPDIANKGVPYVSAGVTTNGLDSLRHYFAITLTYAQQASLVLKNAQQQGLGMKKWAVITSNTNNFKDAREAMESVLTAAHVPFKDIQVDATNDNGLQGRAAATGTALATGGYDTAFLTTSPGYFIYMSGTASKQGFRGTYTGPGVTMTEVTVAQLVCKATVNVVKANFLAPYPGIDRATQEFKTATGGQYDDIYWSLWGLSQSLESALNASASLTRESFISSMLNATLANGVYPPSRFSNSHFGGTGVYSQRMNCTQKEPNQDIAGTWLTVAGPIFK